jgi:predicted phage-related endonuclease
VDVATEDRTDLEERKAFLESRATGIGATDTPKILGLSRRGTPLSVYREKIGETPPGDMGLPAWLGLKLQGTVGELYSAATGIRLRAANRHFRHREHEWLVCHLDFRAWGKPRLLVECKTRAFMTGWGEDGTADVPVEVWVQVQHEMAVTGATEAHVAVLFGHHTFRVYKILRDVAFIEKMIAQLDVFWHGNVLARIPPEPRAGDARILAAMYPEKDVGVIKIATPEQEKVIEQLLLARHNAAQATQAEDEMENKVRALIGEAEGIRGAGALCTWKKPKPGHHTEWKLIAEAALEMVDELLEWASPGENDVALARLAHIQGLRPLLVGMNTIVKESSPRFLVKENA